LVTQNRNIIAINVIARNVNFIKVISRNIIARNGIGRNENARNAVLNFVNSWKKMTTNVYLGDKPNLKCYPGGGVTFIYLFKFIS